MAEALQEGLCDRSFIAQVKRAKLSNAATCSATLLGQVGFESVSLLGKALRSWHILPFQTPPKLLFWSYDVLVVGFISGMKPCARSRHGD